MEERRLGNREVDGNNNDDMRNEQKWKERQEERKTQRGIETDTSWR